MLLSHMESPGAWSVDALMMTSRWALLDLAAVRCRRAAATLHPFRLVLSDDFDALDDLLAMSRGSLGASVAVPTIAPVFDVVNLTTVTAMTVRLASCPGCSRRAACGRAELSTPAFAQLDGLVEGGTPCGPRDGSGVGAAGSADEEVYVVTC